MSLEVLSWVVTLQLRAGLLRRRHARLIRRSGLFDARFYLAQCAGDPAAQKDPIAHYLLTGAARGLDPSPLFETAAYRARNPAASAAAANPLVHFILSGGGAGRDGAAGSPVPAPSRQVGGETLLLGHPFHAAELASATVLVVDGLPAGTGKAERARMRGILERLRSVGPICFVSASGDGAEDEEGLRRMGVTAVHRDFTAALAHLVAEGHRLRWVLLCGAEPTYRYLPAVRAYAPHAAVIYDTAGLSSVPLRREAEARGDAAALERAERLRRVEKVNASCADVVLVATAEERCALLADAPGAHVEVVAEDHSAASAASAGFAAILSGARFPAGGPMVGEGSAA